MVGTEREFQCFNVSVKTVTATDIQQAVRAISALMRRDPERPIVIAGSPTMVDLDYSESNWACLSLDDLAQKVAHPETGLLPRGAPVLEILEQLVDLPVQASVLSASFSLPGIMTNLVVCFVAVIAFASGRYFYG